MTHNLLHRNADLVAAVEAAKLGCDVTFTIENRLLTLSTGEQFNWKQGSGWVRPDGTPADGRPGL